MALTSHWTLDLTHAQAPKPCECRHPFELAPGATCFLCGHGNTTEPNSLAMNLAKLWMR